MAVRAYGNRSAERRRTPEVLFGVRLVLTLIAVGGVLSGTASAQQLSRLDAHLSADSVRIGERFTVSLVAEHGGDVEVSFPATDAGSDIFGKLEVVGRGAVQRRAAGGGQVDSVVYRVTTFALDSVQVPAMPVRVRTAGDTTTAKTPVRTAAVVSVVGPDAKGIHGVAPPVPFPQPLWTWGVLGLVAATLLGGGVYLWWRRRQPAEAPARPRPDTSQTPFEAATAWIRQLESYDLSDPDAVKPFYVELSNALRVYLARELDVAALERTTREVVETLEQRPDVPAEATTRVRAVLELSDLVKFADARPSADDHEKALREARAALDTLEAAPPPGGERGGRADPPSSPPPAVDGVASASPSDA